MAKVQRQALSIPVTVDERPSIGIFSPDDTGVAKMRKKIRVLEGETLGAKISPTPETIIVDIADQVTAVISFRRWPEPSPEESICAQLSRYVRRLAESYSGCTPSYNALLIQGGLDYIDVAVGRAKDLDHHKRSKVLDHAQGLLKEADRVYERIESDLRLVEDIDLTDFQKAFDLLQTTCKELGVLPSLGDEELDLADLL